MNKLKSIFVMPYMMTSMGIAAYAIYRLAATEYNLGFVGTLLATLPFLGLISTFMIKGLARTSPRLPVILGLGIAGLAISIYEYLIVPQEGLLPLALTLVALLGFLAYDFWYSVFGREPSPSLKLGEDLPGFGLEDSDGNPVSSGSFTGRPALILFYRGNWCPLCMTQVKEIAADYQKLAGFGVQVVLVSPQSHENTRELASRFDVPFQFLVDAGNRAATQLGISIQDGVPMGISGYDPDTVMPTVIMTDAAGKIIFLDQTDNYRVRPEPSAFLEILADRGVVPQAAE